jgi:hypothetical protein
MAKMGTAMVTGRMRLQGGCRGVAPDTERAGLMVDVMGENITHRVLIKLVV